MLGVAASTIRTWSTGDFRRYLSPTAQGGEGRNRNFTDQDIRIIALIHALKGEGMPSDQIHATLRQMQENDWSDLPPMPQSPQNVAPVPMVPAAAAQTEVSVQAKSLLREIAALQERVQDLQGRLDAKDGKVEELLRESSEKQQELLRELAASREQIAELRTLVKLYESGRLKPPAQE
jgi:DNA-binding transcriptional MerR regulator